MIVFASLQDVSCIVPTSCKNVIAKMVMMLIHSPSSWPSSPCSGQSQTSWPSAKEIKNMSDHGAGWWRLFYIADLPRPTHSHRPNASSYFYWFVFELDIQKQDHNRGDMKTILHLLSCLNLLGPAAPCPLLVDASLLPGSPHILLTGAVDRKRTRIHLKQLLPI